MTRTQPLPTVKINVISKTLMDRMPTTEKIRFILDEVEAGKILVLERGLTPREEVQLIEATMSEIDPDRFIGIEMQSTGADREGRWGRLIKGTKGQRPRMVVIGPANLLKTVSRDSQSIEAVIFANEGLLVAEA